MVEITNKRIADFIEPFRVKPGARVRLPHDFDPSGTRKQSKAEAKAILAQATELLAEYQMRLAAQDDYGVVMVLQAMDAAGKDGTIRHVMSGVNPQGVQVSSFKIPSSEDLDHDYLWRYQKRLPERGNIGIFNRSYYEEVLVVRVHPQILAAQKIPAKLKDRGIWKRRFREINDWERYLTDQGYRFVKIFLNVSKEEQRRRFLARVVEPDRNWKFSGNDAKERVFWDDYQKAFGEVLSNTSTPWAPWYVIPADDKPFARVAAAGVLAHTLVEINPKFPRVSKAAREALIAAKVDLEGQAPKGAAANPIEVELAEKAARKAAEKAAEGKEGMTAPVGTGGSAQAAPSVAWFSLTPEAAAAQLKVDPAVGLTTAEADARRAQYGTNSFAEAKKASKWQLFVRQYADPMQVVLLIAGIACLFLPGQFGTGVFLILLTMFNAWMAMNQEGKAEASASALQGMMVVKAKVRRDGDLAEIPMDQLVPGDIVNIEAGDLVPADSRILTAATLEIDESALTGESVPTPKQVDAVAADAALGDRVDMAFMNCQVTRGAGTVLVVTTGMATEVGHISGMLQATAIEKTPLTKQLDALTNQILIIAGVAIVISLALGLYRNIAFQALFLSAISFAVAAIPTALPAVVTAILSKGSQQLAAAGAIMKRLRSVETLGSTSALNSDKTGTLTLNQMTAVQMAIVGRRYAISGDGYQTTGQITHTGGQPDLPLEPYLMPMALCADAEVRDGALVGDPDRGRPGRPGRQGRRRSDAHPRAAPARRDAAVRRGVQDDGHLPRDEGRQRQGRHPRLHQGRPGPAPRPGGVRSRTGRDRRADRAAPRRLPRRERATRDAGSARDGHGPEGLRPEDVRPERRSPARHRGAHAPGHRRDRGSAAARREGGHRGSACGRYPGPHDHR